MKKIGKIGVLLISFFLVSSIFFFINIETYGIEGATRFRGLQLLFIIGIPWFITYSKWANDNIWNKKTSKPVETIKPKSTKTSKEDNSNSEYIKIDKKLFNTILIVLGVIVVFYLGYNSAGNSNTSEVNDDYASAYNNRGNAKYELEDWRGAAIQDYNKVIELDPDDSGAYFNRGNVKYELEDYYGAIEDYNKAIELEPDDAYGYYFRGNAKFKLEDYYGAIEDYNKAIELEPDDAYPYYFRGNAKSELGRINASIVDMTIVPCEDWKKAASLGHTNAANLVKTRCNYCEDWKKAANLGNIYLADMVKRYCN